MKYLYVVATKYNILVLIPTIISTAIHLIALYGAYKVN